MEDIGSLIFYVILGIIALVGSIQGKNKKPNAPPKKAVEHQPDSAPSFPPPPTPPAARPAQATDRTMQVPRTMQPPQPPPRPMQASRTQYQPTTASTQRKPQYTPADPSMEGRYEEPMAGAFSSEGSISESMAGAFSGEGSISKTMAEAFAGEGSIENSMAAAFASEGTSGFRDFSTADFVHTEISDSEIGDAPVYDYNARPGGYILSDGFDLKKAVIYTALLNRKEYSA